jgi:hypothetical protein
MRWHECGLYAVAEQVGALGAHDASFAGGIAPLSANKLLRCRNYRDLIIVNDEQLLY